MTTNTVEFTVTASDGIDAYWIAVGDEDVDLYDGEGEIELPTNANHRLVWWMTGDHKAYISITGREDGEVVVKVVKSKVTDDGEGAGNKPFST